jgi:hypothetical protein
MNNHIKKVFTDIYEKNIWGSKETRSGRGSELKATTKVVKSLPLIFEKYNITGIVDIGCGECNWINKLFPELKYYLGIDVVNDIIINNISKYGSEQIEFDIEEFPYWMANLYGNTYQAVLFADVLVHLPTYVVKQYIDAIKETNIQYIFATTFPELNPNTDVEISEISWRPINMAIEPYNLGEPLEMIRYNEFYVCKTGEKIKEKYIGLWKINKSED